MMAYKLFRFGLEHCSSVTYSRPQDYPPILCQIQRTQTTSLEPKIIDIHKSSYIYNLRSLIVQD